jgi:hypothetical protein
LEIVIVIVLAYFNKHGPNPSYTEDRTLSRAENEQLSDLLTCLTDARKTCGFWLCFLQLRNVKGHPWNHKRVYRIYCALELNLRIKSRKWLKRDIPDALAVPEAPNITWSKDFVADRLEHSATRWVFNRTTTLKDNWAK